MRRVWIAFVVAPLLASLTFGIFGLIAFPIMLVLTFVFAVPMFFFLRRIHWLSWWHAMLAGAVCGVAYCIIDPLLNGFFRFDRLATSNNVFYVGLGASIGIVYWWIGIFKNPAFPFVSNRFPKTFVLVLPIVGALIVLNDSLRFQFDQGRVTTVLQEPSPQAEDGRLLVRLTSGSSVEAEYGDTWPRSMIDGKCVHVMERWSLLRFHRVWEVSVPFGGGVDAC